MEKYDLMSDKAQSFINPAEINRTLAYAKNTATMPLWFALFWTRHAKKKG